MLRFSVIAALALVAGVAFAFAQEKGVESIEVRPARPQPPLWGEIKETEVPITLFYEKQKPIVNADFLLTAGYLTKTDRPFGQIIDAQTEGDAHAAGDIVFINRGSNNGVEPGSRYFVYRRMKEVKDPETNRPFGHVVSIVGKLEVTGVKRSKVTEITGAPETERRGYISHVGVKPNVSSARITKAYTSVLVGDYIVPEFRVQVPKVDPDRPVEAKSLEAMVVAVSPEKNSSAANDVVYLNVGRNNGVFEGDVFGISSRQEEDSAATKYGFKKRVGKVRVIMSRPETATAIVVDATNEIFAGDHASFLQER